MPILLCHFVDRGALVDISVSSGDVISFTVNTRFVGEQLEVDDGKMVFELGAVFKIKRPGP